MENMPYSDQPSLMMQLMQVVIRVRELSWIIRPGLGGGYLCAIHGWQRLPTYHFATRLMLTDTTTDLWVTALDVSVEKLLSFDGNMFESPYGEEQRYEDMSIIRGERVRANIRKSRKGPYVNCKLSNVEVVFV